ncbi:hypothetical protein BCR44DRAFT_1535088 [Catenaria anguillulae PL171]|uniref:Uncharacterized protein n=1 Tax=Catenaria anguillulae PL171 TaxID=765915 RepID=A0A1Y2HFD7_9FUNG|nr:hypothetical protein BCR44DRAFT_1535088 [Catenaria anguillulae PL171]
MCLWCPWLSFSAYVAPTVKCVRSATRGIATVSGMIRGQSIVDMRTWYRGFNRSVTELGGGNFTITGHMARPSPCSVRVTELAVGYWTATFWRDLSALMTDGYVRDKSQMLTDEELMNVLKLEHVVPQSQLGAGIAVVARGNSDTVADSGSIEPAEFKNQLDMPLPRMFHEVQIEAKAQALAEKWDSVSKLSIEDM